MILSRSIARTCGKLRMLDKERIHAKLDELYQYLSELSQIEPKNFDEFQKIEKKRSCERLL